MAIEDVQKKIAGYNGTINVICKDFTSFKLRIPGAENCLNVAASIEALSTLGKCNTLSFFAAIILKVVSWVLCFCILLALKIS